MKKTGCAHCKRAIDGLPFKYKGGVFCRDCKAWIRKQQKDGVFTK